MLHKYFEKEKKKIGIYSSKNKLESEILSKFCATCYRLKNVSTSSLRDVKGHKTELTELLHFAIIELLAFAKRGGESSVKRGSYGAKTRKESPFRRKKFADYLFKLLSRKHG